MNARQNDHLAAWHPHEPELAESQLLWMQEHIASGQSLLDLGCGAGRTLVPMSMMGAVCTGLDLDKEALETCRKTLVQEGVSAELIEADFRNWLSDASAQWDVICCLGNTFCLTWKIKEALELLALIHEHLAPGGMLILDDIPGDLWPELMEGRWQEGLDPEQGRQLVWSRDDAVFAFRDASSVDPDNWNIGPDDVPMRLWTAGSMQLAALASGFDVPVIPSGAGVRVLRPVAGTDCTP
ncbi:MAG: class I SAM-dependent methyltransferase [Phycisphaerales bacterium]|nr:class I SAM-dependent methyltransferase [Phycisphaerales bacterium]